MTDLYILFMFYCTYITCKNKNIDATRVIGNLITPNTTNSQNNEYINEIYNKILLQKINIGDSEILMFNDGSSLSIKNGQGHFKDKHGTDKYNIEMINTNLNLKRLNNRRQLKGKKHTIVKEPIEVPPPVVGEFNAYPSEMYCRYGCGNLMGITFPYYYRPFFGYGFPLLGTENQFMMGYGGNPLTVIGSQGGLTGGSI